MPSPVAVLPIMESRFFWITLLGLCGLTVAWVSVSAQVAENARIDGLVLELEASQLRASFRLLGVFDDEFERRLNSGLPTEITYQFELKRPRRSWFDKTIERSSLQVIAMHNAVTEEYLINFKHDGSLIESRLVNDLAELRASMTELENFGAFAFADRDQDQRLTFRVRAELGTRTLLAFIPQRLTTPWVESGALQFPGE